MLLNSHYFYETCYWLSIYLCNYLTVKVICDRSTTSKSKGYGFIQFSSEKEATIALQKMDGEVCQKYSPHILLFF